jgi:hypothetical protein
VKDVGGCEISNFRVQSLVQFYLKIWSYSHSNRCSAKQILPERRRARRARRACAPPSSASAPKAVPPEAALCPRPRLSPRAHAPRLLGVLPAARMPWTALYQPVRAADRRSVSGTLPYARRSRWPCYSGIFVVRCRHPVSSRPINAPRSSLLPPPLPRRRTIRVTAVELHPSLFPRSSKRAHSFRRPFRTLDCHLLFGPSPRRRRSRATAPAAAGFRRVPTSARSRPQHRSPTGPR